MRKHYYLDKTRGYFVTDDSIPLHFNRHVIGDALIAGRGALIGWQADTVQEMIFATPILHSEVEPDTIPSEWQRVLGYVPVAPLPVAPLPVAPLPVAPLPVAHEPLINPTESLFVFTFAAGIFVGLTLVYFIC